MLCVCRLQKVSLSITFERKGGRIKASDSNGELRLEAVLKGDLKIKGDIAENSDSDGGLNGKIRSGFDPISDSKTDKTCVELLNDGSVVSVDNELKGDLASESVVPLGLISRNHSGINGQG